MKRVTHGSNGVRDVNFDVLSFIFGKLNCGSNFNDVVSYLLGKAVSAVWKTITNVAIASFTAVSSTLRELVVDITLVQSGSGDPSPNNIRQISGWVGANITRTGKNQFNKDGELYAVTSRGGHIYDFSSSVTVTGNTINFASARDTYSGRRIRIAKVYANITYTLSLESSESWSCAVYKNTLTPGDASLSSIYSSGSLNKTITNHTFTLSEDGYLYFGYSAATGTTETTVSDIQLESGSSATTYEAYNGTTINVSWADTAGTVYGGTLTDNGDGTWTLTALTKKVTITAFSGEWGSELNGYAVYYSDAETTHAVPQLKRNLIVSDKFAYSYDDKHFMNAWHFGSSNGGNSNHTFLFPFDVVSSLAAANTWAAANPIECTLYLVTPQTYTITAESVRALVGQNNIFADCGNINTITYRER